MAIFEIPIFDYEGKESVSSFPVADGVLNAVLSALFSAVEGMSVGVTGQSTLKTSTNKDAGPGGTPATKTAQRELKWLCHYHDATTLAEHTLEVPCADLSLLAAGTDNMDLSAGAGLALKTQFDATVKAPGTGNAVVLDSCEAIGRNI